MGFISGDGLNPYMLIPNRTALNKGSVNLNAAALLAACTISGSFFNDDSIALNVSSCF